MKRPFHIGDVLTVTTGWMVSPRYVVGMQDILEFITGQNIPHHQMARALRECGPELLKQVPQLANVQVPEFSENDEERATQVEIWLLEQIANYGETFEIESFPEGFYNAGDPMAELSEIAGPDKIVVVDISDE